MYKVSMCINPGKYESWMVMDEDNSYDKMFKVITDFRAFYKGNRKFRLEKHTVEVLDV